MYFDWPQSIVKGNRSLLQIDYRQRPFGYLKEFYFFEMAKNYDTYFCLDQFDHNAQTYYSDANT